MIKKEYEILKLIVNKGGLLSPVDVINVIAKRDRRSVENLVTKGYVKEVPQDIPGIKFGSTRSVNFYRMTEKGLMKFAPWHQKIWFWTKGDVRTVVISMVTALATTIITVFIERFFS